MCGSIAARRQSSRFAGRIVMVRIAAVARYAIWTGLLAAWALTGGAARADEASGKSAPPPAAAQAAKGRKILENFDFHGVTLDDGSLRQQFDEVRDFYLRIPNDDLLKGFRARANRPAPGADLGGLYLIHGIFGQLLSGFARMHAASGDPACREKALALMNGWAECLGPDGYPFPKGYGGLPPYDYDKMVGGLVDIHRYCADREALVHLSRITDWAARNLAGVEKHINEPHPNWFGINGEWYTLSENLYRAYLTTGDPKYRRLAEEFEYTDYWNLLAKKSDIFQRPGWPGWYHAYGHVNTLSGAAAAYLAKGDKHYLDVIQAGYDFVQERTFATGGYGPNEVLTPPDKLAGLLRDTTRSFETQCGSWAAFKLAKYLMTFTGDAKYGDWIERLVINATSATIPMDPDGRVFYYSDYNLGGAAKKNIETGWPCCSGSRTEAVTDYHDLIYFHDNDGLYVNLFAPSTVRWSRKGQRITLVQRTRFPEADRVELAVALDGPMEFVISVRVPGWLAGPLKASINGQPATAAADPLHWARLRRTWHSGDRLTLELPMALRLCRIDPQREFPVAILCGPTVLAARSLDKNPSRKFDFEHLARSLVPVPGQPLNFRLASDPSVLLRPFYQYKAGEKYFMYLDPVENKFGNWFDNIRFSPGWADSGQWRAADKPGATAEFAFEGTAVRILGYWFDDAGRGEVRIDGAVAGIIDQYKPVRGVKTQWEFAKLKPGRHEVKITVLPGPNRDAKGNHVNLAGFEPIP
jgi:uncharacterized protein